ncbi:MAG: site-specific integrase, partial [Thermoanaerobaculia bacterium]|nr:site-specific integrase [Thermoanaerobaculia bacterium]
MTRYPGFSYDAKTKTAHFDCYVPGSAGRLRRRKTVTDLTRKAALDAWRTFVDGLAATSNQPDTLPPEIPTLVAFIASTYPKISAGFKPSTKRSHGNILKLHLLPTFGALRLDRITAVHVRDFQVDLQTREYAPSFINDCVRVLKMLLHQAVERDVLPAYPIRKRVPRLREPLLRLELSESERKTFLAVFDDRGAFGRALDGKRRAHPLAQSSHFAVARRFGGDRLPESPAADDYFARFQWLKPLFVVALETGLRRGDLLALRWDAVNLADGWIRVRMEKTGLEAVIPISVACREALTLCRIRAVVGVLVFVDEAGQPISETRLKRTFTRAKELAGITRRCRFHDLRHTFASRLVSRGVGLKVVATALG